MIHAFLFVTENDRVSPCIIIIIIIYSNITERLSLSDYHDHNYNYQLFHWTHRGCTSDTDELFVTWCVCVCVCVYMCINRNV